MITTSKSIKHFNLENFQINEVSKELSLNEATPITSKEVMFSLKLNNPNL